jgi:hypothetical protein
MAIAAAFPHMKCSVLDLEQVISKAPASDRVQFIAGDMFDFVPPADAVLIKVLVRTTSIYLSLFQFHSLPPYIGNI